MEHIKRRFVGLLRWSERYTKTDMVYLARGGSWVTILHFTTAFVGLLASIAFANLLSPETFGEYKYVLSVAGILAALTLPGINTALTRAAAQNLDGSLMTAWRVKFLWGLSASVTSAGLSIFYFLKENSGLALAFLFTALFLPVVEASLGYYSFLSGKGLFKDAAKKQSFIVIGTAALVILSAFLSNQVFVVIGAYFLSWALLSLGVFIKTRREFVTNNLQDTGMVTYGAHLSVMGVISSIAAYLDKILLFNFLGPAQVALFSFATVLPQNVKSAIRNISQVAFPKFANRTLSHIGASLHAKVILATVLIIPFAAAYWILAPFIFQYLFPQYTDAVFFSQLYGIIIILSPKVLYKTALEANQRKKELYIFQVVSSLLKISLLIVLILLFGIAGAVYATLATELFVYIFIALLFEHAKKREVISPKGT